jgi:pantoate--beta-alanine ligase
MRVIRTIKEMDDFSRKEKLNGKTIGFVPTMGYLHEGHLSLIRRAREENDLVVASIFVNPTQFGPQEDLDSYPRDEEGDCKKLENEGVSAVFIPSADEMYPEGYQTYVEVMELTKYLCGRFRPNHFRGVTTIVLKLFNIVDPDRAYFGKKDYQQFRAIERMVKDLNLGIKIVPCAIVREKDGLAMSSRNKYLTVQERADATIIHKAIEKGKRLILGGERDASKVIQMMKEMIQSVRTLKKIDYVSIVDIETLEDVSFINKDVLIAVAAYFGKARLIDNTEVFLNAKNNAQV